MKKLQFYKIRILLFSYIIRFCALILRTPLPQKVSAGAFIEKDGKFLVVDLSYRKGYGFPGGMIEINENLEQGLKREVFEETGLECTKITYIGSKEDLQYGYPTLAVAFVVEVNGNLNSSTEGNTVWKTAEAINQNQAYKNWTYLLNLYLEKYENTCH